MIRAHVVRGKNLKSAMGDKNKSKHTSSTFIPIRSSGEILMQLRDDGGGKKILYPNAWNFLGGAVEDGENHLEAAVREAREECDLELDASHYKLIFVYSHDNTFSDYVYVCEVGESWEPKVNEGRKMRWMKLEEIKKLQLGFEQEKIIPELEKFLRTRK